MTDRIETLVACAVLMDEQGRCLLNSRPEGKVYAGWWEFPGGKLEAMETVEEAARREVREELGLDMQTSAPWVTLRFEYPHAKVRLHFVRSWQWKGTPRALEKQQSFGFFAPDEWPSPLLEASEPLRRWMTLPVHWLKIRSGKLEEAVQVIKDRHFDAEILGVEQSLLFDCWRQELQALGIKEIWVDAAADREIQEKADGVFVDETQDLKSVFNKRFAVKADYSQWTEIAQSGALFAWVDPTVRVASSAWLRLMADNPVPLFLTNIKINDEKLLRPHGAHGWIETI